MKFTYILCFSFASFARPGFINRILKRDDTSDFQDIMLTTHNNDRATHGVSALTWSSELESQANSYASQCEWQHSGTNGVGENLAVANYFDEQGSFKQVVQQEVDSWYAEGNTCDFSNPSSCGGHFTQMVWSATTEVGCGYSVCPGMMGWSGNVVMMVCQYSPPGNVVGEYNSNVFSNNGNPTVTIADPPVAYTGSDIPEVIIAAPPVVYSDSAPPPC